MLALAGSNGRWCHGRVLRCEPLPLASREWARPVFSADGHGNDSFDANGIQVFHGDEFANAEIYRDTWARGTDVIYVQPAKIDPRERFSLGSAINQPQRSGQGGIALTAAAEAFLALAAQCGSAGIGERQLLDEVNRLAKAGPVARAVPSG